MSDVTKSVKIAIVGQDDGSVRRMFQNAGQEADSARKKIEAMSSTQRGRARSQAQEEAEDRASWQRGREMRAADLRAERSARNSAMMEDMRRLNLYGSSSNSYGNGGGGGGGGAAGVGSVGGANPLAKMLARRMGLGQEFGELSHLSRGFGMSAVGVGSVAALGGTILAAKHLADETIKIRELQRAYNAEVAESGRRWRDVAEQVMPTTAMGASFLKLASDARERAARERDSLAKDYAPGIFGRAGEFAKDFLSPSRMEDKGLRGRRAMMAEIEAENAAKGAEWERDKFYKRAGEDRASEWSRLYMGRNLDETLATQQGRVDMDTKDAQRASGRKYDDMYETFRNARDKEISAYQEENRAKLNDPAVQAKITEMQSSRDTQAAKIIAERNAADTDLEDKGKEKKAQLQQKHNRDFEDNQKAHDRRMLDLQGQQAAASLSLQGDEHGARLAAIKSEYESEVRAIDDRLEKELRAESDAEKRKALEKQAAQDKASAEERRKLGEGGENRSYGFSQADRQAAFRNRITGIHEDLAGRSLRMAGHNYEADKYAIDAKEREQLQGLQQQMEQEIRTNKGDEKAIRERYAALAGETSQQSQMSRAELEQQRQRMINPTQYFGIAGESRLLTGAVPAGANAVADNTKQTAEQTKKVKDAVDLVKTEITNLIVALTGMQPQLAKATP